MQVGEYNPFETKEVPTCAVDFLQEGVGFLITLGDVQ